MQLQALRQLENGPQLDYEGPRQRQTHEDDAQMHPLRLRNPQVISQRALQGQKIFIFSLGRVVTIFALFPNIQTPLIRVIT